jgi:hypothetical protein
VKKAAEGVYSGYERPEPNQAKKWKILFMLNSTCMFMCNSPGGLKL